MQMVSLEENDFGVNLLCLLVLDFLCLFVGDIMVLQDL